MGGVAERDLRTLVDFMYHGELEVGHDCELEEGHDIIMVRWQIEKQTNYLSNWEFHGDELEMSKSWHSREILEQVLNSLMT